MLVGTNSGRTGVPPALCRHPDGGRGLGSSIRSRTLAKNILRTNDHSTSAASTVTQVSARHWQLAAIAFFPPARPDQSRRKLLTDLRAAWYAVAVRYTGQKGIARFSRTEILSCADSRSCEPEDHSSPRSSKTAWRKKSSHSEQIRPKLENLKKCRCGLFFFT